MARSCTTWDESNNDNVCTPTISAGINRPPPSETISHIPRVPSLRNTQQDTRLSHLGSVTISKSTLSPPPPIPTPFSRPRSHIAAWLSTFTAAVDPCTGKIMVDFDWPRRVHQPPLISLLNYICAPHQSIRLHHRTNSHYSPHAIFLQVAAPIATDRVQILRRPSITVS